MSKKNCLSFILLFISAVIIAQKTAIYSSLTSDYDHAIELYQNKAYVAAQSKFNELKSQFDNSTELRANCEYYAANCAIRLGQRNSDDLMQDFVKKYPTSTKRNGAFLEVANYYYNTGKYAYAAKWFSKVNTTNLSYKKEEDFNFKYAYSLFANKSYSLAKEHFLPLLDSQKYGAKAKYYYGYIAYKLDDYKTANTYFEDVENDLNFKSNVSYYLADMNFKLGNFEKAIEYGLPLLKKAKRLEHSEISKIIGESYFNLKKYNEAIPYLKNYKGQRGKWNNTDYYFLGYAYYKQNDYENAINYFNKIIGGKNQISQNAYYHLAECYIKLNKKSEALNAFRNSSQMNFNSDIQKDAWLNYAKLSYDIGNAYQSVPEVLIEYTQLYPNSKHNSEINNLLISAYISSKDYKGALSYLKDKKSTNDKKTYQKVAYYLGVEQFLEEKFSLAIENFDNSLATLIDSDFAIKALYWKGESNFRLKNYTEALRDLKDFESKFNAKKTEEYKNINYAIGYTYFKLKNYNNAIAEFKKFSANSKDHQKLNDAYLRIADSYFSISKYTNAISYYSKAIELNSNRTDYAQFQKAICYGLINQETNKINTLKSFLNANLKSRYNDDALYVLGNSYIKKHKNEMAIESFDQLINNFSRSSFVSKAMIKKGIVYYNTDQNQKALTIYKSVVNKFPNTDASKQAIANARKIYIDLGNMDEYAAWVQTIDFVNVSNSELDNDTFEAAEKQYLQNNTSKAISGFKKYLKSFPNGLHSLQANYFLAQTLFNTNQHSEAIPYFSEVITVENSEYLENSLSSLAQIYLENNNWESAIPILEKLEKNSESQKNTLFAQSNLMKGYYENKNYNKAVKYADLVLKIPTIENRIKADAQQIIARTAIQTGNEDNARATYKKLEKIANGEQKAEALYYDAFFENKDGSYRVSNEITQKIAANFASYKYWASKSLIVMASNYYELNDAFQATYILESVIKNFSQFEDVKSEASKALNLIKTEQAKTNESIKN